MQPREAVVVDAADLVVPQHPGGGKKKKKGQAEAERSWNPGVERAPD